MCTEDTAGIFGLLMISAKPISLPFFDLTVLLALFVNASFSEKYSATLFSKIEKKLFLKSEF